MKDKLNEEEIKRCKQLINEIDDLFYAVKLEINHGDYVGRSYLQEKMSGITTDIKCLNSLLTDWEEK